MIKSKPAWKGSHAATFRVCKITAHATLGCEPLEVPLAMRQEDLTSLYKCQVAQGLCCAKTCHQVHGVSHEG